MAHKLWPTWKIRLNEIKAYAKYAISFQLCQIKLSGTKYQNKQLGAITIETAGAHNDGTKNTVRDINPRLNEATWYQRENFWLMQRLSLAVKRGNAATIICDEKERQKYSEI